MPRPRYGEACHAVSALVDGAEHAPTREAADPDPTTISSAATVAAATSLPLTAAQDCEQVLGKGVERLEQAVDLVTRVVVRDPGAEREPRQARAEGHAIPVAGRPDTDSPL